MTLYKRETEREREQEQFKKLFLPFANFFKILKFFKQFKLFYTIQIFLNFSYFSTNLDFFLPLFIFIYLCVPLFTFVQLTHLCINFVLVVSPYFKVTISQCAMANNILDDHPKKESFPNWG